MAREAKVKTLILEILKANDYAVQASIRAAMEREELYCPMKVPEEFLRDLQVHLQKAENSHSELKYWDIIERCLAVSPDLSTIVWSSRSSLILQAPPKSSDISTDCVVHENYTDPEAFWKTGSAIIDNIKSMNMREQLGRIATGSTVTSLSWGQATKIAQFYSPADRLWEYLQLPEDLRCFTAWLVLSVLAQRTRTMKHGAHHCNRANCINRTHIYNGSANQNGHDRVRAKENIAVREAALDFLDRLKPLFEVSDQTEQALIYTVIMSRADLGKRIDDGKERLAAIRSIEGFADSPHLRKTHDQAVSAVNFFVAVHNYKLDLEQSGGLPALTEMVDI